ncbi:MAG TPA: 3',5'-nucleoside bisphosphate phosphatase [Burkholderiales bacterium]|nr:3',5'-nucleoside bisphosphate phosphatase [Burkholderiales bacterium]
MNIDLHCHSNVSDGALAPAAVAQRAARNGVDVWALTDHDQLAGLAEAREAARAAGMRFVDGVEISVTWRGSTIHVVGLRIDPANAALAGGLARVRGGRLERARRMAQELKDAGIDGAFEGALRHAENPAMVSRTHFARYLAEIGAVPEMKDAFRHYLVPGKPGYVPHQWAALADAVGWICAAGGHAVLAHPGRYGLSGAALDALLAEFRAAGGEAIEVVTGSHSPEQFRHFGAIALQQGFAASRGSDFHGPEEGAEFGTLPPLDPALRAVWRDWAL